MAVTSPAPAAPLPTTPTAQRPATKRKKTPKPKPTQPVDAHPVADLVPDSDSDPVPDVEARVDAETHPEVETRASKIRQLRELMERTGRVTHEEQETLSTGCSLIDSWLPRGGLRRDAITEWVAAGEACGAASLSLIAAAIRLSQTGSPSQAGAGGPLVVVSGSAGRRGAGFYPPAAQALGIEMSRLIWVRPKSHADLVWAIDQALRCPAVAAVWAEIGAQLDDRDARRFQLAAESGGTPGLFVRPASVRGCPSFAEVRFQVAMPASDRAGQAGSDRVMRVSLDRCRGGQSGQQTWVRVDDRARIQSITVPSITTPSTPTVQDETTVLPLVAELAHPKSSSRHPGRRRA